MKAVLIQIKELFAWNDIKRPWHLSVLAAIAVGIPALIGAAMDQFAIATLSSLGAMVILYQPQTRVAHRMVTLALALGCMLSCFLVLFYSLMTGAINLPASKIETDPQVNAIILESALVAFFIGFSYIIAVIFALPNALWVPISCAAILQGATYRMIWHRNIHRIVGTTLGMGVAWLLFAMHPNYWVLALSMMLFQFIVELLILRNYGAAVIFVTPLTVVMAELTRSGISTELLLHHRLVDISIGSAIGIIGGTIFHRTSLLKYIEARMNVRNSLSGRKCS